jgi:hypothetical protein
MKGQLEVLRWLRRQDPPCPWNEIQCRDTLACCTSWRNEKNWREWLASSMTLE